MTTAPEPGRTAYEALAERLRAWGENDADPAYFQGDALSCLLLDCGAAGEAIAQMQIDRDSAEKVMEMAATSGGFYARHAENATKRAEAAEARFARLLIAFHDAIRRPLGVTPDSGAEFYDPRMADEAEMRRVRGGQP